MTSTLRLALPSGEPAPHTWGPLPDGGNLDLLQLAITISRLYRAEYPDEVLRYSPAAHAWCIHDKQHLLNWAAESAFGYLDMHTEVAWLAGILEARDFPLDRLVRSLHISASVVRTTVNPRWAQPLSEVLHTAATFVQDHGTFLH